MRAEDEVAPNSPLSLSPVFADLMNRLDMAYPLPLKVALNWLPLESLPMRANPALER